MPIAQIYMFILFVSASVLFDGVFSQWVSLKLPRDLSYSSKEK